MCRRAATPPPTWRKTCTIFIVELKLGPAVLVGHSFGAVVAMHAAVLYPDIVRGLILSDPYFPGLAHLEPNLAEMHAWRDVRDALVAAGVALDEEINFTQLFRSVAALTPAQKEHFGKIMGESSLRWLSQLPRLAPTTCGRDVFAASRVECGAYLRGSAAGDRTLRRAYVVPGDTPVLGSKFVEHPSGDCAGRQTRSSFAKYRCFRSTGAKVFARIEPRLAGGKRNFRNPARCRVCPDGSRRQAPGARPAIRIAHLASVRS